MREFVIGTDTQYDMLRSALEDRLCHVYMNCLFPRSFSSPSGRIGFEKQDETYALFIDKGIHCSSRKASSLLKEWLSEGTLKFLDFTDMKTFLRSLSDLY
ncbi:MAG: hypothetical protein J5750_07315 [Clostridiales bacterium]|nr:hypothetical protein [Clostridiales bacterium]